ncbi:MAG: N-acetylglucosamine-6-phosphate deacetylase [Planctomycetaceae bacterium]
MTTLHAIDYQSLRPVAVHFLNDRIDSVQSLDCDADLAASLPFVAPGLFDIQINGYHGLWFCSETLTEDEVTRIALALADRGVPQFFPTLITCSFEAMLHGVNTIRQACLGNKLVAGMVRGIHLEGPSISDQDGPRGAHPRQHVRPACLKELERWQEASGGMIRLITLAPESPGAVDFIRSATAQGIVISIGHTAATPDQIHAAIQAGATLSTHLGNGCAAMINRHRNIFWPQLADDRLSVSVIADGWHVPGDMLKCIVRCKSYDRLLLTCDVSGFGGCDPGSYQAGGVAVDVLDDGRIVVAGQTEFLAGSGATTGDCVAQLLNVMKPENSDTPLSLLHDIWNAGSTKPASVFGFNNRSLRAGNEATFTLFRLPSTDTQSGTKYSFQAVASYSEGVQVSSLASGTGAD